MEGNVQYEPALPAKNLFRIGEVSRLTATKQFVLRYWETEFAVLSPKKSGTGHRLYRRKDVELLLRIKHLLYDRKFTIEGARQRLHEEAHQAEHDHDRQSHSQRFELVHDCRQAGVHDYPSKQRYTGHQHALTERDIGKAREKAHSR